MAKVTLSDFGFDSASPEARFGLSSTAAQPPQRPPVLQSPVASDAMRAGVGYGLKAPGRANVVEREPEPAGEVTLGAFADAEPRSGLAGERFGAGNKAGAQDETDVLLDRIIARSSELLDNVFAGYDETRAANRVGAAASLLDEPAAPTAAERFGAGAARGESRTDPAVRDEIRAAKAADLLAEAKVLQQRAGSVQPSESTRAFVEAESFDGAWQAFKQDPVGIILEVGARSAAPSAQGLVAGAVGGLAAGPAGFAAGMGVGSAQIEYAHGIVEGLRNAGIDPSDPKALQAAVRDDALMGEIKADAARGAAIVGGFDAAAGAIAPLKLAPKSLGAITRELVNLPAQMGAQAALGAAGEAGKQLANEGRITQPGQIAAEAAGETVFAPVEVATAAMTARGDVNAENGLRKAFTGEELTDGEATALGRSGYLALDEAGEVQVTETGQAKAETLFNRDAGAKPRAGLSADADDTEQTGAASSPEPALDESTETNPMEVSNGEETGIESRPGSGLRQPGAEGRAEAQAAQQRSAGGRPEQRAGHDGRAQLDQQPLAGDGDAPSTEGAVAPIDIAADDAAESPTNDTPTPTDKQKEAGNYKKGHVRIAGLDVSIENPNGSIRSGTDAGGKKWRSKVAGHYGYIRGTEGNDGDHVDVYVRPGTENPETAFVVDQYNADGSFDEHKVVLGAETAEAARALYRDNYPKNWKGDRAITPMPIDDFKAWLREGDMRAPAAPVAPKGLTKAEVAARTEAAKPAVLAPKTVTRGMRTDLSDLGYEKADIDAMAPDIAVEVIAEARRKPGAAISRSEKSRARIQKMRQIDNQNDDIITAIRKLGGINTDLESDWRGRLSHLNAKDKRPGMPGIEQTGDAGLSLDELAERLAEEGYIGSPTDAYDQGELAELLSRAEMGEPVFGNAPAADALERQAADYADMEDALENEVIDELPDAVQQATGAPTPPTPEDDIAALGSGTRFDDDAYEAGWDTETRALLEWFEEASRYDADAAEDILSTGTNDAAVVRRLIEVINNGRAEESARESGRGAEQGAQGQAAGPTEADSQEAASSGIAESYERDPSAVLDKTRSDGVAEPARGTASGRRRDPIPGQSELDFDVFVPPTSPLAEPKAREQLATRTGAVQVAGLPSAIDRASTPEDVAHVVAALRKTPQEKMLAVVTDKDDRVLTVIQHTMGTIDGAAVYPGYLASHVSAVEGAANVWFAHNHPSGRADQSGADKAITIKLHALMQGTGIEPRGMVVVAPGGQSSYDPGGEGSYPVKIRPGRRTFQIPVTERRFTRVGKMGEKLSDPQATRQVIDQISGGKDGVLLLDTKNTPVGFVPMAASEMGRLRTGRAGEGATRLWRAMAESNANSLIARVHSENDLGAAQNLGGFAANSDGRLLDIIYGKDASSAAMIGNLGGSGVFMSRKRPPQQSVGDMFGTDGDMFSRAGRSSAPAADPPRAGGDLFGEDTRDAQAMADEKRRRDERRSPNTDVPADIDGGLFARQTQDIESAPSRSGRIDDFGEKLEGARKHYAEAYRDSMRDAADPLTAPLSQAWPEPKYDQLLEAGADPWAVAFAHAARDMVPGMPRRDYARRRWAREVELLRGLTEEALDGKLTSQTFARQELENENAFKDLSARIDLYRAAGHARSLKDLRITVGAFSIYNGEKHDPPITLWQVKPRFGVKRTKWPEVLAVGSDRASMMADFAKRMAAGENVPQKGTAKGVHFTLYQDRLTEQLFVGKKMGRDVLRVHTFVSGTRVPDASAYMREHQVELEAILQRMTDIPSERADTERPREGEDYRNGVDVTPERFGDTFGFRGVQFGNYVEGPRRQMDLNNAYDALMDMARVAGLPTQAVSLHGTLGLAFGARGKGGKGGAKAHFEPDKVVINLTKKTGAGSLGHEWWHALDNYFSRAAGSPHGLFTESTRPPSEGVRPEMIEAFRTLRDTIRNSGMAKRARELDTRRSKDYWGTTGEMSARAFEAYLIDRLGTQNHLNDYLANVLSENAWKAATTLGIEQGGYPYPTREEMPPIAEAFDGFFETLQTRETDSGTLLFSRARTNATDTPAFKQWFGDSKVVDAGGAPKVVYHGSPDAREIFGDQPGFSSAMKRHAGTDANEAYFFTNDRAVARTYTDAHRAMDYQNAQNAVLQVYLSLQNPMEIDAKGTSWGERGGPRSQAEQITEAKAKGHDGLIIRNTLDTYQVNGNRRADVFVVFDPRQIKSAESGPVRDLYDGSEIPGSGPNSGAFDSSNPDIRAARAYHGTPHSFDQFSLDAIGTGEGAQAYGWGLYFADKRAIADWYREGLAGIKINGRHVTVTQGGHLNNPGVGGNVDTNPEAHVHQRLMWDIHEYGSANPQRVADYIDIDAEKAATPQITADGATIGDWRLARNKHGNLDVFFAGRFDSAFMHGDIDRAVASLKESNPSIERKAAFLREAAAYARSISRDDIEPAGFLYQVDVPEASELLDWDELIEDQPAGVLSKLRATDWFEYAEGQAQDNADRAGENATGRDIYHWLTEDYTPQEASQMLNEAGIPGLRYADATSRGRDAGSHNYVIWDENAVTVQAVNDELRQAEVAAARAHREAAPTGRPVPATDQENADVETLRQALARYLGRDDVDLSAADVPTLSASTARELAPLFGKRVVFFQTSDPQIAGFNGLALPGTDVVYLNADAEVAHTALLGHELTHYLKRERPDLWAQVEAVASEELRNSEEYRAWLDGAMAGEGFTASSELLQEEMIADFIGDQFLKPLFWDRVMRNAEPSIAQRLAGTLRRFLDNVLQWLNQRGFGGSRYVSDIERMRDVAAQAFADYAADNAEAETEAQGVSAAASRARPDEPVTVVSVPGNWRAMSMRDLKRAVQSYAVQRFGGQTFKNRDDGSTIEIPRRGIKHTLNVPISRSAAYATRELPSLIERGIYRGTEPDKRGRPDILAAHFYEAQALVDGETVAVEIVVREHADGRRFYDHYEIKNPGGTSGTNTREGALRHQPSPGSDRRTGLKQESALKGLQLPNSVSESESRVSGAANRSSNTPPDADDPLASRRRVSDKTLAKVGLRSDKRSLADRMVAYFRQPGDAIREDMQAMADSARQGVFDRFHALKVAEQRALGRNIPTEQSAYVAARLSTGTASVMRALLMHGAPEYRDGIIQYQEDSQGLLDLLGPVKSDLDDWLGWMVGRRANRLMREGRENNLTQTEIDELLALAEGREKLFQQVADDYAAFKTAVLDVAQTAGLIDAETRPAWDMADHIPFFRADKAQDKPKGPFKRKGLSHQESGVRTLRGGSEALNDPLENIVLNFTHLIDASMKNQALSRAIENLVGSEFVESVGYQFGPVMAPMDALRKDLEAEGVRMDTLPPDVLTGMRRILAMHPPRDRDVVRVMIEGKPKFYRVKQPGLLTALTAIDEKALPLGMFRWFKQLLTGAVTADPSFIARNFMRDTLHAWTISDDAFVPIVDSLKGLGSTLTEGEGTRDMMFAGGSFLGGYLNANDPGEVARSIRRALRAKGYSTSKADDFLATVIDKPLRLWELYRDLGDAVENANREAVYQAALKAGKSKAQAVFEAKDLMDYSMRGSWTVVQALTDMVPFMNARLQGLYKLGRAGAIPGPGMKLSVAMRGSVIMAATLALYALNRGDDRYEELEEWDKDLYWHVWLGDHHLRIPKPFEIGLIYGMAPERIARAMEGRDDPEKTFERFSFAFLSTLSFNPIPQAVLPWIELWANKSFFTGREIEGMRDQGLLTEYRYSAFTSDTARWLSKLGGAKVGLSPKEIEHLIEGYAGTLGGYALSMADMLVREVEGSPERPAMTASQVPLLNALYRGTAPPYRTRYITELYDAYREAQQINRTVNALDEQGKTDEADAQIEANPNLYDNRKWINRAVRAMGDINKEIDAIYRDPRMSAREKREAIEPLQIERNRIAEDEMQSLEASAE